jgi:hypothetical protein
MTPSQMPSLARCRAFASLAVAVLVVGCGESVSVTQGDHLDFVIMGQ